jgi:hypothetical protein
MYFIIFIALLWIRFQHFGKLYLNTEYHLATLIKIIMFINFTLNLSTVQ